MRAVTAMMSRRWPGNFMPSSRRSYGENIASMAWGARNLISTGVLKREDRMPLEPSWRERGCDYFFETTYLLTRKNLRSATRRGG